MKRYVERQGSIAGGVFGLATVKSEPIASGTVGDYMAVKYGVVPGFGIRKVLCRKAL